MLCIRCGSPNQGQPKLCGKCGAVLPRSAGDPAGTGDPSESWSYDAPAISYPNDALDALGEVVDRFFEDEAGFEDVEERILVLEQRLSTLLEDLNPALEALRTQRDHLPDDSLAQQVDFLIKVGVGKLNHAIDGLYLALEHEDDEAIEPLLAQLAAGNDYVCHAGTLMDRIVTQIEEAMS